MSPEFAVSADPELLTYLTDAADVAPGQLAPRVGDPIELRPRRGGRDIEAWSAEGIRLGRLPPAERAALDDLIAATTLPLRGRITALVPRPHQIGAGRIHIRVTTAEG
ncbi:hypothetical protein [Belnapia rosea]|uniref:Uncharacterized protein n=1 Tax=Belnapia rosea TaxID=938405 RepID=A0A1G6M831_9PROT|nr:hypothetical protein [Belnapia rosea]SDB44008.1 hypothetical protein SAMN02927895_01574 [Belnapia rosea]SDC51497.1 hypothetical protein SAMN04487779_10011125 [Belnapia rosea]